MAVIGFDFGTTNSLISVIDGTRAINFLDEERMPIPSVVCYEGMQTIVGRKAKDRLGKAGLGVHGNVVRSPKMLLGQDNVYINSVEHSPVDIVADVVDFVAKQAISSQRGLSLARIDQAVVTIPVNMEGYRRAALRDAFLKAGVNIVQFVHEPLAGLYAFLRSQPDFNSALRQFDRKFILVFDWGGGTLDLTLCQIVDGMLFQIKNDGTDTVGGDVFDDVLMNEIVRKVITERGLTHDVKSEPHAMLRLRHHCERAKIDLSSRDRVEIYVPNFFQKITDPDFNYTLTRDDLESITAPLLDTGLSRINTLMESAGLIQAQISLCLATGGMTGMPAIRERLHEWFGGPQRVHVSERSGTLVAEGAAWIAHDKVNLHLAKNVELLLARNSHMVLLRAGTEMPVEGQTSEAQFHLYCTDPRDGHAKFQLEAPVRPGPSVLANDRRVLLDSLVVKVDEKALPFRERLELDIKIDHNLVLHAKARSLNKKDYVGTEVHDLEFCLCLTQKSSGWKDDIQPLEAVAEMVTHNKGELSIRSNIADQENKIFIPGELLHSYDPHYFDQRRSPPEVQLEEHMYYVPCTICGRAANDPLCSCWEKINKQ
jgi:actin-like ATPase involved in cell morphogenesis